MANYNTPGIAPVDDIEIRINELFDGLFLRLHQRRLALIAAYHDLRDDKAARPFTRINKFEQLVGLKAETERRLQLNELRELQERVLADIEQELEELNTPQPETHIVFRAQSEPLDKLIAGLGEVIEEEEVAPVVPKYDNMRQVVAVGKEGKAPGELWGPNVVTVDPNTNNIFVTEGDILQSHVRISIFSEKGDYLDSFTHRDMEWPYGIAIHGEYVYITDIIVHAVFCFKKRNDYYLITKVRLQGTQSSFSRPYSLFVSSTGDVYVTDYDNNRIQIFNSSLVYMRNLTEQKIRKPRDIKITSGEVYVLCEDNPCVHVFSHTGERLRSLISTGSLMEITDPHFFCLDPAGNILISDWSSKAIKIFSKEENHIQTIQVEKNDGTESYSSLVFALTNELNLVVVSNFSEFPLRIFSCMNL